MVLTRRSGAATVAAAVTAGIQGVIILVISKAALTDDDFAPVAQLWAIWAVCAASFNYGCQQWAATRPAGAGIITTATGRRLLVSLITIGLLLAASTYAVRGELFASDSFAWPVFAGLLPLGTAMVGLNRGELARTGRDGALAFVIGAENTLRLLVTVLLALASAAAWTYGAALLLGFLVALVPHPRRDYTAAVDLRPLATATGSGMAAHALLFGSPVALALGGGSSDDVVALFLVLSAVRAPFVLLQGLIPHIAVRFGHGVDELRSTVRLLTAVGTGVAAAAFAVGALLGDLVVGTVFSIRGDVDALTYGLIAAAGMISVTMTIVTIRMVTGEAITTLVAAWALPVVATIVAVVTHFLDDITVTAWWILGCHLVVAAIVTVGIPSSSPNEPATPSAVRR